MLNSMVKVNEWYFQKIGATNQPTCMLSCLYLQVCCTTENGHAHNPGNARVPIQKKRRDPLSKTNLTKNHHVH